MGVQDQTTVWCLLGKKAGDNTQVRALAAQLDCEVVEKHIAARPWELLSHLALPVSLAGIDRRASSPLTAPWPELVISAGRRNEPVARWIRKQSGDSTRLVHIGRPWAPLDCYDLIITTPQYFLPAQGNILRNQLPLADFDARSLAAAGAVLEPQVRYQPRPWIAVLAGGDSGKFVFTPAKGESLGRAARVLAESQGGSLMVTDSARTPKAAGDALQSRLRGIDFCYRRSEEGDNPYPGLLALADAFVVTGESMSMLGEALQTGKPLYIFDLGDGDLPWWQCLHMLRYKPLSHRLAMHLVPRRMRRDVGRIQQLLVDSGRAIWLQDSGEDYPVITLAPPQQAGREVPDQRRELEAAGAAVRQLLESH